MHNRIIILLKNGLIVLFLVLLMVVSFQKEKIIAQSEGEYIDLNAEIISNKTPKKAEQTEN